MAGSVEYTFAQVDFAFWESLEQSSSLPKWLSLSLLAYGRMGTNGHAQIPPTELRQRIFPEVNLQTGEVLAVPTPPNQKRLLKRHIAEAVQRGWLWPGSQPACLVVPPGVSMGRVQGKHGLCPVHGSAVKRSTMDLPLHEFRAADRAYGLAKSL